MSGGIPCLVACGANQGDCDSTLRAACDRLSAIAEIDELSASRWRVTKAIGGPDGQDEFLNGAFAFQTSLSPSELHERMLSIEEGLGRMRTTRWGPRKIDLDLLLYGDTCLSEPGLVLPHPRMTFRRFVLEPAAEVAPEMLVPFSGCTIAELLECLDQRPSLVLLDCFAPQTWLSIAKSPQQDWLEQVYRLLDEASTEDLQLAFGRSDLMSDREVVAQWLATEQSVERNVRRRTLVTTREALPSESEDQLLPKLRVASPLGPFVGDENVGELIREGQIFEATYGPYLDLRNAAPEAAAVELLAAIEAMI